jgi:hypothetical protein
VTDQGNLSPVRAASRNRPPIILRCMMRSTAKAGVLLLAAASLALAPPAQGQTQVVFSQPPDLAGGVIKSSWFPPDGLDGDSYAYDSFILGSDQAITEVDWRGGYTNFLSGAGESPVFDFTIYIYGPGLVNSEPALTPLTQYSVGGNAGETLAGTFGGVPMYDYRFALAPPFQAAAGTKYWVQIEASQGLTPFPAYWPPDWGIAVGTGGDGSHFQVTTGGTAGGGNSRQILSHDTAFSLLAAAGSNTATATGTSTNTPTPPPTTTATSTPTATAISGSCVGDCNNNRSVTVDELLTMVNIALGNAAVSLCTPGDANGDQKITVDEILAAVNHALNGCGGG